MAGLDASRVVNGTYGQVFDAAGRWLMNVKSFEAKVDVEYEEFQTGGDLWKKQKLKSLKGTGSITGFKVTSDWLQALSTTRFGTPYATEFISKLADPQSYGAERIRFKNVQFDTIPLANFEVGQLVEEEIPFTFSDYELLDTIKAT